MKPSCGLYAPFQGGANITVKYLCGVKCHTHLHVDTAACVSTVERACSRQDSRAASASMLPCLPDPFLLCTVPSQNVGGVTPREPAGTHPGCHGENSCTRACNTAHTALQAGDRRGSPALCACAVVLAFLPFRL